MPEEAVGNALWLSEEAAQQAIKNAENRMEDPVLARYRLTNILIYQTCRRSRSSVTSVCNTETFNSKAFIGFEENFALERQRVWTIVWTRV